MRFFVSAVFLCVSTSAFAPNYRGNVGFQSKTSLSMSAALIVQNKGGGHGELGKDSYGMAPLY
jgi:hypothetical protein